MAAARQWSFKCRPWQHSEYFEILNQRLSHDGFVIRELVSSGVNEVYRLACGNYLKLFDPEFVDTERLSRFYKDVNDSHSSSFKIALPVMRISPTRELCHSSDGRTVFAWTIYEPAQGSPVPIGDTRIPVIAAKHFREIAQNCADCFDTYVTLQLRSLVDLLVGETENWIGTHADSTARHIRSLLQFAIESDVDAFFTDYEISHGDMHHMNIFSSPSSITVIDPDFICKAPTGYDEATALWMSLRKLQDGSSPNDSITCHPLIVQAQKIRHDLCGRENKYWLALLILRHVFFLLIQVKLWRYRGSAYATDHRTRREISYFESLLSSFSR